MPVSASVSDSELLRIIWQLSFWLALVSIIVMLLLILRRAWQRRRQVQMSVRREIFGRIMQTGLNLAVPLDAESIPPCKRRDLPVICGLALDMLRPLRGAEVQRIIAMLDLWDVRPYLRRKLRHGSRGERIRALTLLAHWRDEESIRLLLNHAAHEDIYAQLAALRGLALSGDTDHIPEALNGLSYSRQHNTLMLTDILKRFGPPAVHPLITLAQGAAAPEVRLAAVMALCAIGSLEAVEPLIALAKDGNADMRAQALAALGRLGDGRAREVVLAALNDPEDSVRIQAIQAAGVLGLQAALPILAEYLADSSWWVRFRAAEAMVKLGASGTALLKASRNEAGPAGVIASQVLAEKGIVHE